MEIVQKIWECFHRPLKLESAFLAILSASNARLLVEEGIIDCIVKLCAPESLLFGLSEEQRATLESQICGKMWTAQVVDPNE